MGPRCLLWVHIPVFPVPTRVLNFKSTEPDSSSLVHSSGASIGPRDGDLDSCTSCDGGFDDDATFSFQTYLVRELDFGRVSSSFTTSTSSSSFLGS